MDITANFSTWLENLNMAIFTNGDFGLPLGHLILVFGFASFCILWAKYKTGLLVSYLYLFYYAFTHSQIQLIKIMGGDSIGMVGYIFLGMSVTLFGLVSLIHDET